MQLKVAKLARSENAVRCAIVRKWLWWEHRQMAAYYSDIARSWLSSIRIEAVIFTRSATLQG